MLLSPFIKLIKQGQRLTTIRTNALFKPFYQLSFLAAAKQCGLMEALHDNPLSFDQLANTYCHDEKSREALQAWLQLGSRLGLLQLTLAGYRLKGMALKLSQPENDSTLALAQEVATLHHKLIMGTPGKLTRRQLWQLDDQDGELTARSSRALEVFQIEAIDRAFSATGDARLLEIGCGSAIYIRHAATLNPSLQATGLELQPAVAAVARQNISNWGLEDRVSIETGDIRDRTAVAEFNYVTLYNNIYYFPVNERVDLLKRLKAFLKPGGKLVITTCCQCGNPGIEVLNLWGAATAGGGRLPDVEEMREQLIEAGFRQIEVIRLIPGDSFYAFVSCNE